MSMRLVLFILILVGPASVASGQTGSPGSVLMDEGVHAMEEGNYAGATDHFKELLGIDSLHARARFHLAQVYHKRGKRLLAARHARLSVRHDKSNVDHLILRHQIGFINPVPIARARKRAFLNKILEVEPDNPYAHTEIAREHAFIYLNHKGRVRVTDFAPAPNNIAQPAIAPANSGVALPGEEPIRVSESV